jgi:hypothetical protein
MPATIHPIGAAKAALRAHFLLVPEISARLGNAIFIDHQRGLKPPYIVLGDATGLDRGSVGSEAMLVELDMQIVTHERGTADALALAAALEGALQTPLPPLEAHSLSFVEIRQLLVRHDPASGFTRAMFKLRAFIEPL